MKKLIVSLSFVEVEGKGHYHHCPSPSLFLSVCSLLHQCVLLCLHLCLHGYAHMRLICYFSILTELVYSFLFCPCVYFCLYGPFNCISFHIFSQQLSAFSLSSSSLISALLVLSALHLFTKVSFSPDIIHCG